MQFLVDLWLPIVLAGVGVFVASSVIHMALPIHKSDFSQLPNEPRVLEALRTQGVGPGQYMFPKPASMKDCSSPEMLEKFKRGPVGSLIVLPTGVPNIGKSLLQWFVFSLVVGVFVAYIAWHQLAPGAPYLAVFRLTATVAFLAYGFSHMTDAIWKGVSWTTTLKFVLDGLIYGLVTGGVFGWQWPAVGG
ncbi:MAG TPA: hypothetical protein VMV01_19910 [Planctomycetota bacterium]|jgi:hypothetical protein|nr:hypothetical protein [Planctomycetota bacterium]HZJ72257.1 hypothetical protein [Planctomycetota bacterium]